MAWSRKSKKKADRVVRRVLNDGTTREYRYPAYKAKPPKHAADSLQALINAFRASQKWADFSLSTKTSYNIYLRELEEAGTAIVGEITRRYLLDAQDAIARERGNGAASGFMRAAGSLFGWAVDRGWIDRSPVHRIPKRPGGSLAAWSPEQAAIALGGLPEHLRRVVILGAYTGQRRGDLCSLRWDAYDGESLRVTQQKTGATLMISAHRELRRELDGWKAGATTVTILSNQVGRPWNPHSLSDTLPRALKKLDLPKGLNVHGLRKMFASMLADEGASTHQIAAGTGHKTLGMIAHYTRSADQKRLSASGISLLPKIVPLTTYKKRT